MDMLTYAVVGLLVGAGLGFLFASLAGNAKLADSRARLEAQATQIAGLELAATTATAETRSVQAELANARALGERLETQLQEREIAQRQRLIDLQQKETQLKETFAQLSQEALAASTLQLIKQSESILKQYKESADGDFSKKQLAISALVEPIKEKLANLEKSTTEIEKNRNTSYGELMQQVKGMTTQQDDLKKETNRLIKALQDPGTSGQWGEMVLRRVIELAGLNNRVDFEEQVSGDTEGGRQRPDVIVSLPGGRKLVIDSKASMKAYTESLEAPDEVSRQNLLRVHGTKVMERAKELGKKDYLSKDHESVDFSVMFIPSESAYRAALEAKPQIMEDAMALNVVIASPANLLGLLRAVAYGWKQDSLAENAKQIQTDAHRLYETLCTLTDHYTKLGSNLQRAMKSYNEFGGSLERKVLPAARRFKDMGIASNSTLPELEEIAFTPRPLQADEFALPNLNHVDEQ